MSSFEVTQGVSIWLPYIALDAVTETPRTGILFTQVDVSYKKSTQISFVTKVLTAADFRENGSGIYEILFDSSEVDVTGSFLYVVNGNGSLPAPTVKQYVGHVIVTSSPSGSVFLSTNIITGNIVDLNGVAIQNASVSAKVLSAPSVVGAVSPNVAGVTTDIVTARTDASGFFALEILQGAVVDIVIPLINYRRTMTVPSNATDVLWDIP